MSLLFASLLALVPGASPDPRASVIAVFEIVDVTERFTPAELEALTDYFSASLAKSQAFEVVPKSEVRQALARQKAESYKACYDESCQIEIGRELAAQKSVLTRIIQVGSRCAITSTLLDVARAASERASTVKSECSPDAIFDALDEVVGELTGAAPAPPSGLAVAPPPPPPPPAPSPPLPGVLQIRSLPEGAEVRVDGVVVGQTPLTWSEAQAGPHRVLVAKAGLRPYEGDALLAPGGTLQLDAQLVDAAAYADAEASHERATFWAGLTGVGALLSAGTGVLLWALAPSEQSIAIGSYDRYLITGVPGDPLAYRAVEDDVALHNTLVTGALISAGAAAVLTALSVVLLPGEGPSGSTGAWGEGP